MNDKELEAAVALVPAEPEDEVDYQIVDLGKGAPQFRIPVTRNINYNIDEKRVTVTPEAAALHRDLARMESETRIKEADKRYVEPIRVMTRPLWACIGILGAAGFVLLFKEQYKWAVLCFGGIAITPILDAAAKWLKRKGEPE